MADNVKNSLISQICQQSGLSGSSLTALKARLEKLSEAELNAELQRLLTGNIKPDNTGLVVERTTTVSQSNSAPHPNQLGDVSKLDEDARDALAKGTSISIITNNLKSANNIFTNKDYGIVRQGYDDLKSEFNIKKSSNVAKVMEYQHLGIALLADAEHNKLTRKEYYLKNKNHLVNLIITRMEVLKNNTEVPLIDIFRGDYSREELKEIIGKYIDTLLLEGYDSKNPEKIIENIKTLQKDFLKKDLAEEIEALNHIADSAKSYQEQVSLQSLRTVEGEPITFANSNTIPIEWNSDEIISFEEVYKLERGVDFSSEKVENFSLRKAELDNVINAFNLKEKFINDTKAIINENTSYQEKERKLFAFFNEFYSIQEGKGIVELNKILSQIKPPIQIVDGNLDFGTAYPDDEFKTRAIHNFLRVAQQEKIKDFQAFLGKNKTIEDYQAAYQKASVELLGKEDSELLAEAMENDNITVIQRYTGMASTGGMVLTAVGGILCFTPFAAAGVVMLGAGNTLALGGMVAKNGLEALDLKTQNEQTEEEKNELTKNLIVDAGGFVVGMVAGKAGTKAFSKLIDAKLAAVYGQQIASGNKLQALKTVFTNPDYLRNFMSAAGVKISADFLISYVGDLTMMGVFDTQDDWQSLLKANLIGIMVGMAGDIKDISGAGVNNRVNRGANNGVKSGTNPEVKVTADADAPTLKDNDAEVKADAPRPENPVVSETDTTEPISSRVEDSKSVLENDIEKPKDPYEKALANRVNKKYRHRFTPDEARLLAPYMKENADIINELADITIANSGYYSNMERLDAQGIITLLDTYKKNKEATIKLLQVATYSTGGYINLKLSPNEIKQLAEICQDDFGLIAEISSEQTFLDFEGLKNVYQRNKNVLDEIINLLNMKNQAGFPRIGILSNAELLAPSLKSYSEATLKLIEMTGSNIKEPLFAIYEIKKLAPLFDINPEYCLKEINNWKISGENPKFNDLYKKLCVLDLESTKAYLNSRVDYELNTLPRMKEEVKAEINKIQDPELLKHVINAIDNNNKRIYSFVRTLAEFEVLKTQGFDAMDKDLIKSIEINSLFSKKTLQQRYDEIMSITDSAKRQKELDNFNFNLVTRLFANITDNMISTSDLYQTMIKDFVNNDYRVIMDEVEAKTGLKVLGTFRDCWKLNKEKYIYLSQKSLDILAGMDSRTKELYYKYNLLSEYYLAENNYYDILKNIPENRIKILEKLGVLRTLDHYSPKAFDDFAKILDEHWQRILKYDLLNPQKGISLVDITELVKNCDDNQIENFLKREINDIQNGFNTVIRAELKVELAKLNDEDYKFLTDELGLIQDSIIDIYPRTEGHIDAALLGENVLKYVKNSLSTVKFIQILPKVKEFSIELTKLGFRPEDVAIEIGAMIRNIHPDDISASSFDINIWKEGIQKVNYLYSKIKEKPELYVNGLENASKAEYEAKVIKFFTKNKMALTKLANSLDKEALLLLMRKRFDDVEEYLELLQNFNIEDLELLKALSNSNNASGKPFLPNQKIDLIDLIYAYKIIELPLDKMCAMYESGRIDIGELQLDLFNHLMKKTGMTDEEIASIPKEKLIIWDTRFSHLLAKEMEGDFTPADTMHRPTEAGDRAFADIIRAANLKDFDKYIHDPANIYGQTNAKTKTIFEKLKMNYEKWAHPDKALERTFEVHDAKSIALQNLSSNLVEVIEKLRLTPVKGFVDKQFPHCIKGGEFKIPTDIIGNKAKLKEFIESLLKQLEAVEKRAQGNLNHTDPARAQMARNNLDLIDAIRNSLKTIDTIEDGKVQKRMNWTIKMWDRVPQKDLFQGNYSTCCIGMGGGNGSAMPHFIMNTAYNMIELVDNETGKIVGNALCYFIQNADGKPSFIIDNIEISNSQIPSGGNSYALRDQIADYAKSVAQSVTGDENVSVYMGGEYNDVLIDDLSTQKAKVSFLGELECEDIYMDLYEGWVSTEDFTKVVTLFNLK